MSVTTNAFLNGTDAQVGCRPGFQTCKSRDFPRPADLEIGETAGLETCATEVTAK